MKPSQYVWNDVMSFIHSKDQTSTHFKIALCIIKHYHEIPLMKIDDFAKITGASASNISKFCQAINLKGFGDLKHEIANETNNKPRLLDLKASFDQRNLIDAFQIYDSRITMELFMLLRQNENVETLMSSLKKDAKVLILAPHYTSNLILQFTMVSQNKGITAIALSRNTDKDIILDQASRSDVLMIISSSGTWFNTHTDLVKDLMRLDLKKFVVGTDSILEFSDKYPSLIPISLSQKERLVDFHYASERIYGLFFSYLTLQL